MVSISKTSAVKKALEDVHFLGIQISELFHSISQGPLMLELN